MTFFYKHFNKVIIEKNRNSWYKFFQRFLMQKPERTVCFLPFHFSCAAVISVLPAGCFRKSGYFQTHIQNFPCPDNLVSGADGFNRLAWWYSIVEQYKRQTKNLPPSVKKIFPGYSRYTLRQFKYSHYRSINRKIYISKLQQHLSLV